MEALWVNNFPGSIMVCDREGIIMEMNEKACATFQKYGGRELIGKSVLACHPLAAREKLWSMIENEGFNCYTIERDG